MFSLQPPRHIPTLPIASLRLWAGHFRSTPNSRHTAAPRQYQERPEPKFQRAYSWEIFSIDLSFDIGLSFKPVPLLTLDRIVSLSRLVDGYVRTMHNG